MVNIYVGNISRDVSESELFAVFEPFGKVQSARLIKDQYSGQSRGFGFVEMESSDEGKKAIQSLNGTSLKGRALTVNEARPKSDNRGSGGGEYRKKRGGQGFNRW
jgi:RNA recognition motif-containing protein